MSSESEMELLSVLLKQLEKQGMVVLTGLPSTCKTEVAHRLASWANCPVLCIQDFLGGGGWSYRVDPDFSPPTTKEEVECHHRKAFLTLLNAAHRHLDNEVSNCVIIKASLNTDYEYQLLLKLNRVFRSFTLIIMECKVSNEYLWKSRFENLISYALYDDSKRWSRPRSWNDIEKALDDYTAQPPSRDLHLLHQRLYNDVHDIIWLVVDPFYDLYVDQKDISFDPLPDEFNKAITYLLTIGVQEFHQSSYLVDYDELRRLLFEKEINAAALKGRSGDFCHGNCVFKYREALENCEANSCGVCEDRIMYEPAYTCHFCIASLHKTCAERIDIKLLQSGPIFMFYYNSSSFDGKYPCKSCQVNGRAFSEECRSCIFQNHVKCHQALTIINHDCHNHFLSVQLPNKDLRCKACGDSSSYSFRTYGCKRCAYYCHLPCTLLPLVLKHEHGGHEHVMKLMFSRDGMDKEDDYWCDCCYEDMDPQVWFYSCQTCPHYAVHLYCAGAYDVEIKLN